MNKQDYYVKNDMRNDCYKYGTGTGYGAGAGYGTIKPDKRLAAEIAAAKRKVAVSKGMCILLLLTLIIQILMISMN